MPRVYDSRSDPRDFCQRCFPPTEEIAFKLFGNLGDGPDGRGNCFGYDDAHPPYLETDYKCEVCRKPLDSEDDDKQEVFNGAHSS